MSTSEPNERNRNWAERLTKGYGVVTAITLLFSVIYEYNSHGVYSFHMIFLALYPLAGGVLVFFLLAHPGKKWSPHWITVGAYQAALLSFMFGSLVKGILDIYGTSSLYVSVYWWAGIVFAVLCVGSMVMLSIFQKRKQEGKIDEEETG